jgi:hypothetical protein
VIEGVFIDTYGVEINLCSVNLPTARSIHRLIVIVAVVIMLFELTPEKSIWSVLVKHVEGHIMLYPSDVPIIDYQISNIYIL